MAAALHAVTIKTEVADVADSQTAVVKQEKTASPACTPSAAASGDDESWWKEYVLVGNSKSVSEKEVSLLRSFKRPRMCGFVASPTNTNNTGIKCSNDTVQGNSKNTTQGSSKKMSHERNHHTLQGSGNNTAQGNRVNMEQENIKRELPEVVSEHQPSQDVKTEPLCDGGGLFVERGLVKREVQGSCEQPANPAVSSDGLCYEGGVDTSSGNHLYNSALSAAAAAGVVIVDVADSVGDPGADLAPPLASTNNIDSVALNTNTELTNTAADALCSAGGSSSSSNNIIGSTSNRSLLRNVRIKAEPMEQDATSAVVRTGTTEMANWPLRPKTEVAPVTVKQEQPEGTEHLPNLVYILDENPYPTDASSNLTSKSPTDSLPVKFDEEEEMLEYEHNVDSVDEGGGDEEYLEDDDEEEDETDDDEYSEEREVLEFQTSARARSKIRNLTANIKTARLKGFRKEKPIKMRLKSGVMSSNGEFLPYSYQCPYCPFFTCHIIQMKRHRIRHIADGALNCKRCEYSTKIKEEYKRHLIKHYQADTSSDESDDQQQPESESNISGNNTDGGATESETGNKELYVYQKPAPLIPGGPLNMGTGIITVPETKLFEKILDLRCKYCPFFTTYRSIMNQHRTIHQAEGVMYCPQCDLSTLNKEEYKTHLMKHYAKDSFTCEYCGYSTISQYLYINHTGKHTEKTYCCDDCSYTTGFKKAFKYHRLKHSAEKLLRCKHCPFITKYRHNYRQHMATHTGKGLLFCDFCSYYSAWETNFSRHLARHKMEEEARKLEEQARLEAELSFATKEK